MMLTLKLKKGNCVSVMNYGTLIRFTNEEEFSGEIIYREMNITGIFYFRVKRYPKVDPPISKEIDVRLDIFEFIKMKIK